MLRRHAIPDYAELHCRSNFSFLSGASHPEELIARAQALRYTALAVTDECSLAGIVRAHVDAERLKFPLIVGAEMQLAGDPKLLPATTSSGGSQNETDKSGSKKSAARNSGKSSSASHGDRRHDNSASNSSHRDKNNSNRNRNSGGNDMTLASREPERVPATPPEPRLVLLAESRRGYGNLVRWITVARQRAPKGQYLALRSDLEGKMPTAPMLAGLPGCLALLVPDPLHGFETVFAHAMWLKTWFGNDRAFIAVQLVHGANDAALVRTILRVAEFTGLPVVATGGVLMHVRSRKALLDVLTATRLKQPISACGLALQPNAERHLRSRVRLARLYRPEWLENTLAIAGRCNFSMSALKYEYPREIVPDGQTPTSWLRQLTTQGAHDRFEGRVPEKVARKIDHELALIERLNYEAYFLTVADIVRWARAKGILCQGRGSAANSVVCYCLGVTAVNPELNEMLLFERFLSAERQEPPDIDVDFEHQRREEVIQYIYKKYGRHRAALAAVVISYRPRSALRDAGRALGLDADRIQAVGKGQHWFDGRHIDPDRLRENGFDADSPLCRLWTELTQQLIGFPRHLSQHPGGFVIARDDLADLVPVEMASMPDRSVIQWDKDDLDALRLVKVDILALGMLSAIRRALEMVSAKEGRTRELHQIPADDKRTYDMLCRADSIGVFQVESRAQMSMLPRLKPREYYDLVVEVAIVRPGPIQGGMVHPYLKRRAGEELPDIPKEELNAALQRTLGVPIFQEQVMQIAMIAAEFSAGEADQLRRAMAAWKRRGGLGTFAKRLIDRMIERGYEKEFAERIFKQMEGFGEYGFPESHAASFALLVVASAWIKRHHPDAFLAGLLNSQPMGFYQPAQLVRDAREHGVTVLPADVLHSDWESTLEGPLLPRAMGHARSNPHEELPRARQDGAAAAQGGQPTDVAAAGGTQPCAGQATALVAIGTQVDVGVGIEHPLRSVRLGLNRIVGFDKNSAERLMAARAQAPFADAEDLSRRAALDGSALGLLARADALASLTGHRHQSAWAVAGVDTRPTRLLQDTRTHEAAAALQAPAEAETVLADYRATGLSLTRHPLALLRNQLAAFKVQTAAVLQHYPSGRLARASGIVTHRQRPETAKGVIFVTLEDETGAVNVIVWPSVAEAQRRPLLASTLLTVYGIWQCQGSGDSVVRHLVARKLVDHSALLQGIAPKSRNFH